MLWRVDQNKNDLYNDAENWILGFARDWTGPENIGYAIAIEKKALGDHNSHLFDLNKFAFQKKFFHASSECRIRKLKEERKLKKKQEKSVNNKNGYIYTYLYFYIY